MSPQMRIVVEIAAVGMLLLFAALGALVSLMYLLTNPTIFGEPGREARRARRKARRLKKRGQPVPVVADEPKVDVRQERLDEQHRRRRAAALAAAIACAGGDAVMVFSQDAPADWRLLHRSLRLHQRVGRRPALVRDARGGPAAPRQGGGAG